jgi:NinB protein
MDKHQFKLVTPRVRQNAVAAINAAPNGYYVTVTPPRRSLDQNAKLHAMITDIMLQSNLPYGIDVWKTLLMDDVARETGDLDFKVKTLPALNGTDYVVMGHKTSRLTMAQMAVLIEACYRYGAQNGVVWKHDVDYGEMR